MRDCSLINKAFDKNIDSLININEICFGGGGRFLPCLSNGSRGGNVATVHLRTKRILEGKYVLP